MHLLVPKLAPVNDYGRLPSPDWSVKVDRIYLPEQQVQGPPVRMFLRVAKVRLTEPGQAHRLREAHLQVALAGPGFRERLRVPRERLVWRGFRERRLPGFPVPVFRRGVPR